MRTQRNCDHISIGDPYLVFWSNPTTREGYNLQVCGLQRAFYTKPHALLWEVDTQSRGDGERGPLVTVCLVKCPVLGSGRMGQHMWLWLGYSQRRYPDSISSGEKRDAENNADWQWSENHCWLRSPCPRWDRQHRPHRSPSGPRYPVE